MHPINRPRALLLCLGFLLVSVLSACQPEPVGWYGVVERDVHTLTAPVSERIVEIRVREGDLISAGQILLRLDDTLALSRIAQREAELAEANAVLAELEQGPRTENIARARAAVTGAEAGLLDTQQRLDRVQNLIRSGAATAADLDQLTAARDLATAQLRQAQQQLLELENGSRDEQIVQARARVDAAKARLQMEHKTLADLTLVSAHGGVINHLPWQTGDRIVQGHVLATILIADSAYVRVYLPADARASVATGDRLRVLPDQLPAVDATIRHIHSQPAYTPYYALNERDRARLMYLTELALPASASLPVGLSVEVVPTSVGQP